MPQMIYRPIEDLRTLDKNPRFIKDDDFQVLCNSIRENPEYFEARPILLSNRTGSLIIIGGNMRYRAALEVGLTTVPTYLFEGLTAKKEKEYIIRDNVSNGQWDFEVLANDFEIEDLTNWGVDLSKFNIDLPGMDEPKRKPKKSCPHCGEEL